MAHFNRFNETIRRKIDALFWMWQCIQRNVNIKSMTSVRHSFKRRNASLGEKNLIVYKWKIEVVSMRLVRLFNDIILSRILNKYTKEMYDKHIKILLKYNEIRTWNFFLVIDLMTYLWHYLCLQTIIILNILFTNFTSF